MTNSCTPGLSRPGAHGDARHDGWVNVKAAWTRIIRDALRDALAVLVPVSCAGCGAPDRSLCDACRAEFTVTGFTRDLDGVPAFAAVAYEGAVRRAVLALKEHGRTDIARELATPLEAVLLEVATRLGADEGHRVGSNPVAAPLRIVTVPPTRAAKRTRGYDPVSLLLARSRLRPVSVLRWVHSSSVQKALTASGRARNREGALAARRDLAGERFVFVDDVVTSGATAREVIRAIRGARGSVLAIVALAATQRVDGLESSRWVTGVTGSVPARLGVDWAGRKPS